MTHHDRLRIDLAAAAYLDALARDDVDTQARLWGQAAADPGLLAVFQEVHAGLLDENEASDHTATGAAIAQAAETHLTSAEVVRPPTGPVTVGDVADELFRHTPDRLPPEAHALNAALRASSEPLPADLGLSKLTAWAEAKFGPAAAGYWAAFRAAALKLELRQAAVAEFALAARSAPKTEDKG
jgi:hypothetical protein